MAAKHAEVTRVASVLRHYLSKPPSAVGRRLRSEPQLSKVLGVKRWQVSSALDEMVRDGLLFKRKGSGTYIRRLPVAVGTSVDIKLQADSLFAEAPSVIPQSLPRVAGALAHKQLNIEYWTGWRRQFPWSSQRANEAMTERAQSLGHQLSLRTFIRPDMSTVDLKDWPALLEASSASAFIMLHNLLRDLLATGYQFDRPYIGFYYANVPPSWGPGVCLNTEQGIRDAVSNLAASGYQRVAMIGLDYAAQRNKDQIQIGRGAEFAYDSAVRREGLAYSKVVPVGMDIDECRRTVLQLLQAPDRPDAIYCADDFLFNGVATAIRESGLVPGRDLGVISFASTGLPLADGAEWSRMDFDCYLLGRMAVENVVYQSESRSQQPATACVNPVFRPGATHVRG